MAPLEHRLDDADDPCSHAPPTGVARTGGRGGRLGKALSKRIAPFAQKMADRAQFFVDRAKASPLP
jgi:hypothetical protein